MYNEHELNLESEAKSEANINTEAEQLAVAKISNKLLSV